VKWLGYVVVSTELKTNHAINQISLACHHDDWDFRTGTQFPRNLQPAFSSERQIERYEIYIAPFYEPKKLFTRCGFTDPEALGLKTVPQERPDGLFVVDDDNMYGSLIQGCPRAIVSGLLSIIEPKLLQTRKILCRVLLGVAE